MRYDFIIGGKKLGDGSGSDSLSVTYTLDRTTNSIAVGASTKIAMRDDDYDLILDTFFTDCDDRNNTLQAFIKTGCTDALEYEVTSEGVTICTDLCTAEVNLQSIEDRNCLYKLVDTVYWDEGYVDAVNSGQYTMPAVKYHNQPTGVGYQLWRFVTGLINIPLLGLLGINIINSITNWDRTILGGYNFFFAPLFRDIFTYHAQRCGLTFQSSILVDDPIYRNLAFTESRDGGLPGQPELYQGLWNANNQWWGNSFNQTVGQLLDSLKPVFNADWRIIGDKLIFERKDWFDTQARTVSLGGLDSLYPDSSEAGVCYGFVKNKACAYFRGEYAEDAMDAEGNSASTFYNDIVEWNEEPINEWQTGECRADVKDYSTARFMFDGAYCNASRSWRRRVDLSRKKRVKPNHNEPKRSHDLVISEDLTGLPKLLVLEDGFNPFDAQVIKRDTGEQQGVGSKQETCYHYNWPLFFNENYEEPELYQRFWYIDNPRTYPRPQYEVKTIKYIPDDFCQAVNDIHNNFLEVYYTTRFGNAVPGKIAIDFKNCVITATDLVIYCSD